MVGGRRSQRVGWVRTLLPSALVCAALVGLTGVAAHAERSIDGVLNENWRGSYDILVTPPGQDFGAAQTSGLVDASFISTAGQGGIGIAQVEAIRQVDGVEVAAPIGMVGALRNYALSPVLWVPDPVEDASSSVLDPGRVHVFRMTVELTDARGEIPRPLSKNVGHVALQGRAGNPASDISELMATSDPGGFGSLATDREFYVQLGQFPDFSTGIIAIDPVAEQELLGTEHSGFLRDLRQAPRERDLSVAGEDWIDLVDVDRFLGTETDIFSITQDPTLSRDAVPLVVAEATEGSIEMTLRVEPLLAEVPELPTSLSQIRDLTTDAAFGAPVMDVTVDASGITAPFSSPDLLVPWTGTEVPPGEGSVLMSLPSTDLSTALFGRPSYDSTGDRTFEVNPLDVVGPAGHNVDSAEHSETLALQGGDPNIGLTRAYRQATEPSGAQTQAEVLPVPLGTFNLSDLSDPDELAASYVPSGLQPTTPSRISEGPRSGEIVHPAFSNLDFITSPPGAFTDLAGGATLRGDTPVDAVRVRVDGVDTYTPANQERVARIAAQIEDLGLTATIVAGSSPQQVQLWVPLYQPPGSGTTWTDLPPVEQEWTTLGAAVVVDRALTNASRHLAWAAILSVGLGLVATSLLHARGRREEVSALWLLGWRRSAIRRRLAMKQIPGLALITTTAAACLIWADAGLRPTLVALALGAYAVAGASIALAMSSARNRVARSGRKRKPVTSLRSYAARRVTASPLTTALATGGIAVLAMVSGLAVVAWQENLRSAGSTRLATTAIDLTAAAILALGAVGALAALVLLLTGQRIEMRQRATQEATLTRLGFTPRTRRSLLRQEELIMLAMTALAGGAAALALGLFAPDPTYAVAAVGAVTLIVLGARQWAASSNREVDA